MNISESLTSHGNTIELLDIFNFQTFLSLQGENPMLFQSLSKENTPPQASVSTYMVYALM